MPNPRKKSYSPLRQIFHIEKSNSPVDSPKKMKLEDHKGKVFAIKRKISSSSVNSTASPVFSIKKQKIQSKKSYTGTEELIGKDHKEKATDNPIFRFIKIE